MPSAVPANAADAPGVAHNSVARADIRERAAPRVRGLGPAAADTDASSPAAHAASLERAFQSVIDDVAPGVVGIRAERLELESDGTSPEPRRFSVTVNGTGAIIDPSGLLVTNEHVVRGATGILALLHDGRQVPAEVIGADARSDLAVLRIPITGLPALSQGDWSDVRRGQWAIVAGNPFGLGADGQLSVSVGVIANLGRQLPGLGQSDDRLYYDMIQLTAPIGPGNSGGPLFNLRGEFIGIITAMHTRSPADDGVAFAIPLHDRTRRIIARLAAGEVVEYGYLGLVVRQPDGEERISLGSASGVIVHKVEPHGPAARAGLQPGDVLLRFEHSRIFGPAQFAALVGDVTIGARVRLAGLRDDTPLTCTVEIGRRNAESVQAMGPTGRQPQD